MQLTKRNGDWLAAELNNTSYTASCSFLCSSVQISGNTNFCTSSNYSIPSGADFYNWSISGGSGVVLMGNGTPSVTLTNTSNYNGSIVLSVTVGDNAGKCGQKTLTKKIWIGTPKFQIKPDDNNTNYVIFYAVSNDSSLTLEEQGVTPENVIWRRLDNGQTRTGYSYFAIGSGYNWSFDVEVKATNSCGTTTKYATISPPPRNCDNYKLVKTQSSDNYTILKSVDPDCPFDPNNPNKQNNQYQITVANSMGVIIISKTGDTFDLQSFPAGMYVVHISKDNETIINQTLVKN